MVDSQLIRGRIRDPRVLDAMRSVPREAFVEEDLRDLAYNDGPLPIGNGQTISQPYIVALMIEAAAVTARDRVLDVGTGSGYAAAVLSRIAGRVYTIERHSSLADAARRRFAELGYDNIEVRVGDGTLGWPDASPFDVILVGAAAPNIPEILERQLAVGGRLIAPVGGFRSSQTLRKIIRRGEVRFDEEKFAAVSFVPLVGEHGWTDDGRRPAGRSGATAPLPQAIAAAAHALPDIDDPAFGRLFDGYGDRRVVLLGEASQGTSQFYRARAAISRRLITQHGFNIVAVEADWPDAATIDRYVRCRTDQREDATAFQRFPTWMWRNTDVDAFVEWLRSDNEKRAPERRTGFYGLDLYNMHASIAAVLAYLDRVDPDAARSARERYACLTPWQKQSMVGRATPSRGYRDCEQAVLDQCRALLQKQLEYARLNAAEFLDAAQNARLIASAERYYRIMYYGGAESWNLRDTHMFETLEHLLDAAGPRSKAIVWAHNSHIGDARHTEMGRDRREINIGQLCRERFGEQAALIGFGTHTGSVAAAQDWSGPMQIKSVRPSISNSIERLCHDAAMPGFLLELKRDQALARRLAEPRPQRFIGVIYRPETERASHYASASLSDQYDAYLWFDRTTAITPLPASAAPAAIPDTYPSAL